jgi:hypothetical protein
MEITELDKQRLNQARELVNFQQTPAWQYLKDYLVTLGVKDYPDPKDYLDKPQPQESLILAYSRKVGMSDACKSILQFINSQEEIIKSLDKKYSEEIKESVL